MLIFPKGFPLGNFLIRGGDILLKQIDCTRKNSEGKRIICRARMFCKASCLYAKGQSSKADCACAIRVRSSEPIIREGTGKVNGLYAERGRLGKAKLLYVKRERNKAGCACAAEAD